MRCGRRWTAAPAFVLKSRTSQVHPGREHDTTADRTDPDLLTQLAAWVDDGQPGLAAGSGRPSSVPVPCLSCLAGWGRDGRAGRLGRCVCAAR